MHAGEIVAVEIVTTMMAVVRCSDDAIVDVDGVD